MGKPYLICNLYASIFGGTGLFIRERDNFRFSAKAKEESRSGFLWFLVTLCSSFNNMAGLNTSSRSGSRRESLEVTKRSESLASNSQFMQLLRKVPDELERLEREINRLEKEAKASPSR